jgi:hypothetical protein
MFDKDRMKFKVANISHYGDVLAIPFFALLVIYFATIEHKTIMEFVLLLFSICGFFLDIVYTIQFLSPGQKT